jgi:hypothetical protein
MDDETEAFIVRFKEFIDAEIRGKIKKSVDVSYLTELGRTAGQAINALKQRQITGAPAVALMEGLELSLRMGILFSELLQFEPHIKETLTKRLNQLHKI